MISVVLQDWSTPITENMHFSLRINYYSPQYQLCSSRVLMHTVTGGGDLELRYFWSGMIIINIVNNYKLLTN